MRTVLNKSGEATAFLVPDWAFRKKHVPRDEYDDRESLIGIKARFIDPAIPSDDELYLSVGYISKGPDGMSLVGPEAFHKTKTVSLYEKNGKLGLEIPTAKFMEAMSEAVAGDFYDYRKELTFTEVPKSNYRGDLCVDGATYLCYSLPEGNPYGGEYMLIPAETLELQKKTKDGTNTFKVREGEPAFVAVGSVPEKCDTSTEVPDLMIKPVDITELCQDVNNGLLDSEVSFDVPAYAVVKSSNFTMMRFPETGEHAGCMCTFPPLQGDDSDMIKPNDKGGYTVTLKATDRIPVHSTNEGVPATSLTGGQLRKEYAGKDPKEYLPQVEGYFEQIKNGVKSAAGKFRDKFFD